MKLSYKDDKGLIDLVPFKKEHITTSYIDWLNDHNINKYLSTGRETITEDDVGKWDGMRWAIMINTHRYIGTCSMNGISWIDRHANIGYMIGEFGLGGKGIGTAVVKMLTDYGFDTLGLHKLSAGVVDGNIGSVKVLEKNGYKECGREPEDFWLDGEFRDTIRFYRLSEWQKSE